MSNILHILNGDATLNGFEDTGLDGDIMIWREVLSEGPLSKNVSSAAFWEKRSEFISTAFNEPAQDYHEKVVLPLEKLNGQYEEINLWFEFDLHCQVNLLGLMMLLEQQTDLTERAVYLICPATIADVENFSGMGELNGEQLENLYDNIRVRLGEYDFTLATEAWALYVNNDVPGLTDWLGKTPFWGNMLQLQHAMQAHLQRIQLNKAGLNGIHQKLLYIYNNGAGTRQAIYEAFWQTGKIYGMGDKELDLYINQLAGKGLINME